MKPLKITGTLLLLICSFLWPAIDSQAQGTKAFTIYIVFWRGCEESCDGFKEYIAARYQDVGKLAGRQVKLILIDGKKPGDLPILSVDRYAYVVNMTTARKLNMFPSVEILQFAETVE